MARAGPLTGPIAPDLSRKWVRSETYIRDGSAALRHSASGRHVGRLRFGTQQTSAHLTGTRDWPPMPRIRAQTTTAMAGHPLRCAVNKLDTGGIGHRLDANFNVACRITRERGSAHWLSPHAGQPRPLLDRHFHGTIEVRQFHESGATKVAVPGWPIVEGTIAVAVPALLATAARV
jgi:hypothetical protein